MPQHDPDTRVCPAYDGFAPVAVPLSTSRDARGHLPTIPYAGHGHTPRESVLATSIARDLQLNREASREALQDARTSEGV